MKAMLKHLKPYRKGLILSTLAITLATVCDLLGISFETPGRSMKEEIL